MHTHAARLAPNAPRLFMPRPRAAVALAKPLPRLSPVRRPSTAAGAGAAGRTQD